MSQQFQLEGIPITVKNLKNSRNLRISIRGSRVVITKPRAMPMSLAKTFATSKKSWLLKHYKAPEQLYDGAAIGILSLRIESSNPTHYKWDANNLIVFSSTRHKEKPINQIVESALRRKTEERLENALPPLQNLIELSPKKTRVARTISRWGSCSANGTLSFSLYAAKLPDNIFNYLLVHELAHLAQPNHSPSFWQLVESFSPNYKLMRRQLKLYSLDINPKPLEP